MPSFQSLAALPPPPLRSFHQAYPATGPTGRQRADDFSRRHKDTERLCCASRVDAASVTVPTEHPFPPRPSPLTPASPPPNNFSILPPSRSLSLQRHTRGGDQAKNARAPRSRKSEATHYTRRGRNRSLIATHSPAFSRYLLVERTNNRKNTHSIRKIAARQDKAKRKRGSRHRGASAMHRLLYGLTNTHNTVCGWTLLDQSLYVILFLLLVAIFFFLYFQSSFCAAALGGAGCAREH